LVNAGDEAALEVMSGELPAVPRGYEDVDEMQGITAESNP
jgi:hypothetical protein